MRNDTDREFYEALYQRIAARPAVRRPEKPRRRGPQIRARKTHCIHGHERTPENVLPGGKCRACNLIHSRNYKRKKRLAI